MKSSRAVLTAVVVVLVVLVGWWLFHRHTAEYVEAMRAAAEKLCSDTLR